jgi:hypothetical protein
LHVEEIVPPQWRCREELFICRVRLIDGFLDDSYEVSWTVPACFLGCDGMIALLFGSSFAFECWVDGSNDRVDEIRREKKCEGMHVCNFCIAYQIRSEISTFDDANHQSIWRSGGLSVNEHLFIRAPCPVGWLSM